MWSSWRVRIVWAVITLGLLTLAFVLDLPRWWFYGIIIAALGVSFYLQSRARR